MSREIKFKAWDKEDSVMGTVLGFSLYHGAVSVDIGNGRYLQDDASRFALREYTGLKDRNGVEIYEGDIVVAAVPELIFQVVYRAPSFCRKWIDDTSKKYRDPIEPMAWNTHIICEVIGNIYENPELSKEETE